MKNQIFSAVFIILMVSCGNEGGVLTPPEGDCDWKYYKVADVLKNEEAIIQKREVSSSVTLFYIKVTSRTLPVYLSACNLPTSFQKDGIKIRISGDILTYPGIEKINTEVYPFKILTIQAL